MGTRGGRMSLQEIEPSVILDFKSMKVKDIALKYEIKTGTVYYILRKNDIPVINKPEVDDTLIAQFIKEIKNGKSQSDIAKEYGIEKTRLCRIINSFNVSDTMKTSILNLRMAKLKHSLIAQRLNLTTEKVREILRDFNVFKQSGLTQKEIKSFRRLHE